ncbi:hypothetical protein K2173_015798 [Erythroxylum novogranatense]|uniref:Bifunctional inhibitor/plant lipid transfer protein/seed storage helical domain-containing protein n=1 Tax=Erythroxylum novogranatense TaxID=1862640 RepID=A0AAV8TIN4_9ROSI|nr:hypothetical protein K2173_015798 [Erythroxylum novogranatense]
MAKGTMKMVVALALVTILWARAIAQSNCTNVLISMSPCLNYISGNSSTPSSQCCSKLATVVRSSPQCLCQVLNGGGSSLGININQTRTLALPGAYNVQTPSTTRCNAASPAGSPLTESPEAPSSPTESTPSVWFTNFLTKMMCKYVGSLQQCSFSKNRKTLFFVKITFHALFFQLYQQMVSELLILEGCVRV